MNNILVQRLKQKSTNVLFTWREGNPLLLSFPVPFTCQVGLPKEKGYPICVVGLPL